MQTITTQSVHSGLLIIISQWCRESILKRVNHKGSRKWQLFTWTRFENTSKSPNLLLMLTLMSMQLNQLWFERSENETLNLKWRRKRRKRLICESRMNGWSITHIPWKIETQQWTFKGNLLSCFISFGLIWQVRVKKEKTYSKRSNKQGQKKSSTSRSPAKRKRPYLS